MSNQNTNWEPQLSQQPPAKPPRKPWYKKWWIWVIIGVVGTALLGAILPRGQSGITKEQATSAVATTAPKQEEAKSEAKEKTEAPTKKPTETKAVSKEEFINSCKEIDYKTLARNPDKYKGQNYKLSGQVIQVLESDSWFDDATTLRINITAEPNEYAEGGYLWDDTIIASVDIPEGADRILEDDVIDFYGTCDGLYTYNSVINQKVSLPKIDIKYYTIRQ